MSKEMKLRLEWLSKIGHEHVEGERPFCYESEIYSHARYKHFLDIEFFFNFIICNFRYVGKKKAFRISTEVGNMKNFISAEVESFNKIDGVSYSFLEKMRMSCFVILNSRILEIKAHLDFINNTRFRLSRRVDGVMMMEFPGKY